MLLKWRFKLVHQLRFKRVHQILFKLGLINQYSSWTSKVFWGFLSLWVTQSIGLPQHMGDLQSKFKKHQSCHSSCQSEGMFCLRHHEMPSFVGPWGPLRILGYLRECCGQGLRVINLGEQIFIHVTMKNDPIKGISVQKQGRTRESVYKKNTPSFPAWSTSPLLWLRASNT